MDAVILAGGLNSGALRRVSSAQYEAEIEIAGRPMLDYVILALKRVVEIKRILVVGPETVLSAETRQQVTALINPGHSLVESLNNGLKALQTEEPVLVLTSDIPLITCEALQDFLTRCHERNGDIYYSFVSKEVNEAKYPGVQRTYVKLREGVFTGGNLVLLSPRVVRNHMSKLGKAASLRKKPIQLCKMLGWKYLFKLVAGRLTIREIEERVAKLLNLVPVGVISPYPEVGIDVDKPSDLLLVRAALSGMYGEPMSSLSH